MPVGTAMAIQNQTGRILTKWDKTGVIVENRENKQLVIKVDGSRRLTLRNRRFVRSLSSGTRDLPSMSSPTTTSQTPQSVPTAPPTQSSTPPTLTPPTAGNISMLPEIAPVANTAPMVDHYSGPTDNVAESSNVPTNTNPQSFRPVRSRRK